MKKRILTWLLAISMLGSLLTVPAGAAAVTKFSDVSDSYTATAVETLRLMGVLDGYSDGTFRPGAVLTRAQFCKMAVFAMDGSSELGRYSTVTIFPDVKPSHWASSYINMAAKKGVISGFADGKFKPEQTVTAGQAVVLYDGDQVLGGGVIVCPGVRIGNGAIIGAGSVVTRDIPADSVAVGNPARVTRTLSYT